MSHLKIFLWNDDEKIADEWTSVISLPEFGPVVVSTSKTLIEVIDKFKSEAPDIVILDIMCSGGERTMGLNIAEEIRKVDLLIPIIAVTKEPKLVYQATDRFEHLGFAGVFDASVMEKGIFGPIALRPSLNYWHSVAPEFALVRRCSQLARVAFTKHESEFAEEFVSAIEALPFSGSTESWHPQLSKSLASLMRKRGHHNLVERFEKMVGIFQKADPFYMAASSSRRHLSHNVQVFLLGLSVLLGCEPVYRRALVEVEKARAGISSTSALIDAVLIWGCIAITHDTAYLIEHFETLTKDLAILSEEFSLAFDLSARPKPLKKTAWPNKDHGAVGAMLWENNLPAGYECAYFRIIAKAISRHDSKHFPDSPADLSQWADFLAVLSDELQDWGRERLQHAPGARPFQTKTWGMFCLEGVYVGLDRKKKKPTDKPETTQWSVALTFVARDHPEIIARRYGCDGEQTVRDTFERITKSLRKNLRSPEQILVELTVHFVSRQNSNPYRQPVQIAASV